MTSIVDWQIRNFGLGGGIVPFVQSRLNPASYNLGIGYNAEIETEHGFEKISLMDYSRERPLMIEPGGFLLTEVQETIAVPPNMEGIVVLRSSAARAGWQHCLAGYVDPGYIGRLTLELKNYRRFQSLAIYPGQELVQLRLSKLERAPERHYGLTGRYTNASQVERSKDATIY